MTKPIFRIALAFIVLNLIPILWIDKLEFNIATFTTEYYKFLYNIFVVGLIALFFKSQTENISKAFENKKKNSDLTEAISLFNNAINEKDIDTLKSSWLTILSNKADVKLKVEFEKLNRYIENTSKLNMDDRLESQEFISLTNPLK